MGIATSGSVLGTLIGMFFLALFTPILGDLALKFGAYEFFWLALFGVIIAGTLTGDDPLKGWIAGPRRHLHRRDRPGGASTPTTASRFGSRDLAGGFQLVPALVGAFGFAELLMAVREKPVPVKINPFDSVIPKLRDVTQYWRTILRSGRHRHVHRHPARRGRGRRRVVVVCRRQAREQGEGEVRQGLDRRPDGRRNRRQRLRAGRDDSRC